MNAITNSNIRKKNAQYLASKNILIPTFAQMKNSSQTPDMIQKRLKTMDMNAIDPINLYRINWKNEPIKFGGGFQLLPNYIEFPSALTGVKARIIGISGKYFPTGSHKIGSSIACLIPKIISGEFDLQASTAIWPSTGNFCRGGAFNSAILGCKSVAVLPENMSRERFEWLSRISGEVITTSGSESNVKEIYDKVKQLQKERKNVYVFNQFSDTWNYLWHYEVTANAIMELYEALDGDKKRFAGVCLSSGSSGTLGCADAIKEMYPTSKLAVGEAVQCSTLLMNGYGEHRIEGIGDKHVPWIHNVRNTDVVIGLDDDESLSVFKLFNEPNGQRFLKTLGLDDFILDRLNWCGISGAANFLAAIKFAKYFELSQDDVIFTILTDSSEMYGSRLKENIYGSEEDYSLTDAQVAFYSHLANLRTDHVEELSYIGKKRIHNLKYYTWVEQQGMSAEELSCQWYDTDYWDVLHKKVKKVDEEIEMFNADIVCHLNQTH